MLTMNFMKEQMKGIEGQEDVVIFNRISEELKFSINGTFFGWGVGGAPKMPAMLYLLNDLGYKNVVAIFDGDKAKDAETSKKEYPKYRIIVLPKDDIRDKPPCTKKDSKEYPCYRAMKEGLVTEKGTLKDGTNEDIINLLESINTAIGQCGNVDIAMKHDEKTCKLG